MKKTFLIIIRILVSEASKQAFLKAKEKEMREKKKRKRRKKKKMGEERFKEKLP